MEHEWLKEGGPAFPTKQGEWDFKGLSTRDYFAAKAMQGLLANSGGPVQSSAGCGWSYTNCEPHHIATEVYRLADAMLKDREQ